MNRIDHRSGLQHLADRGCAPQQMRPVIGRALRPELSEIRRIGTPTRRAIHSALRRCPTSLLHAIARTLDKKEARDASTRIQWERFRPIVRKNAIARPLTPDLLLKPERFGREGCSFTLPLTAEPPMRGHFVSQVPTDLRALADETHATLKMPTGQGRQARPVRVFTASALIN